MIKFQDQTQLQRFKVVFAALLAIPLVGSLGCGGRATDQVTGTVHFADGSPLTAGTLMLYGGEDPTVQPRGLIKSDGTFELTTFGNEDGAPRGTYRVAIVNAKSAPPADWGERPFNRQLLIHSKYEKPETSGLEFKIPDNTHWDITVEKP
ncbi:hypothetical protein [Blastopirellula marina]|uniref:hypothetical protein n=1 Tax=Blastopirellula marina TaxID=124 RepID=UPI000325F596|nr:hypothetical protein [Blastopirellula marina]